MVENEKGEPVLEENDPEYGLCPSVKDWPTEEEVREAGRKKQPELKGGIIDEHHLPGKWTSHVGGKGRYRISPLIK